MVKKVPIDKKMELIRETIGETAVIFQIGMDKKKVYHILNVDVIFRDGTTKQKNIETKKPSYVG